MFIAHKRKASDEKHLVPGTRVQSSEISEIRELWNKYGKPKTPVEGMFPIESILRKSGLKDFHLSTTTKMRILQSGIEIPGGKMSF